MPTSTPLVTGLRLRPPRTPMSRMPAPRMPHGRAARHSSSTSLANYNPNRLAVPANAPARPDMLYRVANRPLPSLKSLSPYRQWLRTMPLFIGAMAVSALGIFNYQKLNSPAIEATMYSLRTNPRSREFLGDEVFFADNFAWIWGPINLVQGRINVTFRVKGTRRVAVCRFRATRMGGKTGTFETEEWTLTAEDGQVLQLLDDPSGNPLAAAGI